MAAYASSSHKVVMRVIRYVVVSLSTTMTMLACAAAPAAAQTAAAVRPARRAGARGVRALVMRDMGAPWSPQNAAWVMPRPRPSGTPRRSRRGLWHHLARSGAGIRKNSAERAGRGVGGPACGRLAIGMNSLRRVRFSWRRRLLWVPAWVVVALAAIGAWRLYRAGFPPGATPGSAGPLSGAHVGWARQASDETAWHFSVERPELWATSQLPSGRPGGAVAIHFQVAERPRDPWSRWIAPMRCERLFETDQSNSVWSGGPAPQPMPGTVPAVQRAARLGIADEMAAQG